MQSEYFEFNGIKSSEKGQFLIRTDSGMVASPFFGGQSIEEEQASNKITPYHFGTKKSPLEFTIEISPLDKQWTAARRKELGEWLIHDTYKPFQTTDDLSKFYYAIVTEAPNFELYDNKGYIPITFRTNSAYAWSPVLVDEHNLTEITEPTIIEMHNSSNIGQNYRPKIEIEMVDGETKVEIKNTSNSGQTMIFDGTPPRVDGETPYVISIDNDNQLVVSNMVGDNAFKNFNRVWLELTYGTNYIEVTGKCRIWTKMQFPILQ